MKNVTSDENEVNVSRSFAANDRSESVLSCDSIIYLCESFNLTSMSRVDKRV